MQATWELFINKTILHIGCPMDNLQEGTTTRKDFGVQI